MAAVWSRDKCQQLCETNMKLSDTLNTLKTALKILFH